MVLTLYPTASDRLEARKTLYNNDSSVLFNAQKISGGKDN